MSRTRRKKMPQDWDAESHFDAKKVAAKAAAYLSKAKSLHDLETRLGALDLDLQDLAMRGAGKLARGTRKAKGTRTPKRKASSGSRTKSKKAAATTKGKVKTKAKAKSKSKATAKTKRKRSKRPKA